MKIYAKMSDAKDEWFTNLTKLFQKNFDEHKVLPRKWDTVGCLFEEIHHIDQVQWIDSGVIIIWLETDYDYINDHWDNWEEEIQEYVDWYNEKRSDYTGKIKI